MVKNPAFSALCDIDLNLYNQNVLPNLPTLVCLKKTGPLESNLIHNATSNAAGNKRIMHSDAIHTSIKRVIVDRLKRLSKHNVLVCLHHSLYDVINLVFC